VSPVTGASDSAGTGVKNVSLSFVDTAPVVGGRCIYRAEARETGVSEVNPIFDAVQTGSSLRLLLIPTR
jgi:hypothetical protein